MSNEILWYYIDIYYKNMEPIRNMNYGDLLLRYFVIITL